MRHLSKILSFFVFPSLVLFGHLIASKVLGLYASFPNLDIPFHYLGGFSIAYTSAKIISCLEKEKLITTLPPMVALVLVFSLTATAAVFWEFAEFTGDQLLDTNIQISLANTMQDQFVGILGGITVVVFYARQKTLSKLSTNVYIL